jgi:hypothetical protein
MPHKAKVFSRMIEKCLVSDPYALKTSKPLRIKTDVYYYYYYYY